MLIMQKYPSRYMTLRKVGGSLFLTVPADIVRAFRLSAGDGVLWDMEGDVATAKFFRVTETRTPAERVDEAVVDAT